MDNEVRLADSEALHRRQQEQTARVVAEAERMIVEINEVLAEQDRMFAKHNTTPERLLEQLKEIAGTEYERVLKQKLETTLEEARARAEQVQLHQQPTVMVKRPRRLRSTV